MTLSSKPDTLGKHFKRALTITGAVLLSVNAMAQELPEYTDNPEVISLFLESQLQKPADQVTPAERDAALEQLKDLYLVASLPKAVELGKDPRIAAQLELQKVATLFNAFAGDFLTNNPVTDQEVFDAYQDQVALAPPKEFKARHILVETQSEALALIEELKGDGDFVELAKTNSTGPSATSGGDLGWFTAQAMVKPFSDAVAALEDGAFTKDPVQTQFGWHVILREESRDSTPPPLESVKDVIQQRISQQKFQEFLQNLRSDAAK